MKFGIDYGHNCSPDIGASGLVQEDILTKSIGTKVMQKLKALGHQVIDCLPSSASSVVNSLQKRCDIANANNVDIYVSIHFNSFNGEANGTEVFTGSDTGLKIGRPVLSNLVSLGFFNRGLKDGSHLYVLRHTSMPAILVECCFCDSAKDMAIYKAKEVAIADAIVKGLTGQNPPDTASVSDGSTLKVQQSLNKLKITDDSGKSLVEDGATDPQTVAAIKKFQSIVGIGTTGIAGSQTWGALNLILSKPILRPNHAGGPVVRYIQSRVGVTLDGVYGPASANAVKQYQSKNGLTADGIIGPNAWEKLIG